MAGADTELLQAALEDNTERVRAAVAGASELQGLQRSCANAWLLYKRTRPAASPESVTRARSMPAAGVHPLLAVVCPQSSLAGLEAQVGYPASLLLKPKPCGACRLGLLLACRALGDQGWQTFS
jgi:hypothetical protein